MTTMKSILSRLTQAVNGTDKELFSEQELNQFASFYLDKWDENTSEDVVAESFVDYSNKYTRQWLIRQQQPIRLQEPKRQ